MKNCFVHTFPGRYIAFQWVAPVPLPNEVELAQVAFSAIDALREVAEPLSIDLNMVCSDVETRWPEGSIDPAQPCLHLRAAKLEQTLSIKPMYEGANISIAPYLDRQSLNRWIEVALSQPCSNAGAITAWGDISVLATCARIYRQTSDESVLTVSGETGSFEVPVRKLNNNERWACGPVFAAATEPPIDLAFHSEGGTISLVICIHWSWWTDPGTPERLALDQAFEQIRLQGWEEISTDLPMP